LYCFEPGHRRLCPPGCNLNGQLPSVRGAKISGWGEEVKEVREELRGKSVKGPAGKKGNLVLIAGLFFEASIGENE